jgi:hypothetical protein
MKPPLGAIYKVGVVYQMYNSDVKSDVQRWGFYTDSPAPRLRSDSTGPALGVTGFNGSGLAGPALGVTGLSGSGTAGPKSGG